MKVLDFGIAKLTATEGDAAQMGTTTGTGTLLGTPFYMAPEQMFGEKDVDHRADLWAIGVILYEALAGQRPTQGANLGQILKVITKDGIVSLDKLVPGLPAPVLDLVSSLLQEERDRRPADLREVVRVLSAYTSAGPESFGVPRPVVESVVVTPPAAQPRKVDSNDAHAATIDASPRIRARPLVRLVAIGALAVGAAGIASVVALRRPAGAPASPTSRAASAPLSASVATPALSAAPAVVDASPVTAPTSVAPAPVSSLPRVKRTPGLSSQTDAGKDPLEGQY